MGDYAGQKRDSREYYRARKNVASDEICALFLLSADREGTAGPLPEEEEAEQNRIAAILPRFFRQTDITGNLGKGFYAAFLAGNVTGNAVYEKTAALIRALQYSWEEGKNAGSDSWIGVYMFRAQEIPLSICFGRQSTLWRWQRKKTEDTFIFIFQKTYGKK